MSLNRGRCVTNASHLDRHMARHKEKDDEAGGEGLGVLATRKRLWRDTDGKIVNARRPSYSQDGAKRRQLSRSERKGSSSSEDDRKLVHGQSVLSSFASPTMPMSRNGSTASSTIVVDTKGARFQERDTSQKQEDLEQDSWMRLSALPSPPTSDSSNTSAAHSPIAEMAELDTLYEDTWPTMHEGLPQIVNNSPVLGRQLEYPESPSWGPQPFTTFMGAMAEQPYEDIFKPETGIYDWQAWNNQVLMSRCRDEKFESFERKREWGTFPSQDGSFRRAYGMGTC